MGRRCLAKGQAAYSTGEVWKRGCHGVKNYGVKVVIVRMKVQGGLCRAGGVAALHGHYPLLEHYTLASWWGGTQKHKLNAEFFGAENLGVAGLTPSSPLVSCRLTVRSSCCSCLTVWSSPAVSLSFLSTSSCQEGTVGSDCNVQHCSRDQTPRSALASYCL